MNETRGMEWDEVRGMRREEMKVRSSQCQRSANRGIPENLRHKLRPNLELVSEFWPLTSDVGPQNS